MLQLSLKWRGLKLANNRNIADVKDFMKMYFSGELRAKIIRYEQQLNRKFPKFYYENITAWKAIEAQPKNRTGYGDPTAYTAIRLADIKLEHKNTYYFLQSIYDTIESLYLNLNPEDRKITKTEFNINDNNYTSLASQLNMSYSKIRAGGERSRELFRHELSVLLEKAGQRKYSRPVAEC